MLRVSGIRMPVDEEENHIPRYIMKRINIKAHEIIKWSIFRKSIDARKATKLYFVYTVDIEVKNEAALLSEYSNSVVMPVPNMEYDFVPLGEEKLTAPPLVIGTGPAGLFAGLFLAKMGYRPILLERGDEVDTRLEKVKEFWSTGKLDQESNVQFGEGGAGTFSDGKLTTLIKDKRCYKILQEFVEAGAPEEILYHYKPHIGTDILRTVVKNIRHRIIDLGGQVLFRSQVTDLLIKQGRLHGVLVNDKDTIPCQAAVLAVGHSARDVFSLLYQKNISLQPKPFSIGVRIEHRQDLINEAQYKDFANHPKLGAADYKLVYHAPSGRSAYTFCMCPGGSIVAAASENGGVVTNGMSEYSRSGSNANSALLVGINPEDFGADHPLAGVEFQRKWEKKAYQLGGANYFAPYQLVGGFLQDKLTSGWGSVIPTYPRGVKAASLRDCLPKYVTDTLKEAIINFDIKLKGFASEDAILTGVETRSSSPLRILRDDKLEASVAGLYPAGEGAGYAGGIISAAVDGIRAAEAVASFYKPLQTENN